MASLPADVSIRPARPDDRAGVETVLDLAMLSYPTLEAPIEAGDVFLAEAAAEPGAAPVLGALVGTRPDATTWRIDAVAVRPNRRGQGLGTALVETAIGRAGAVGAELVLARFDAGVAPFYRAMGFDIAIDSNGSGSGASAPGSSDSDGNGYDGDGYDGSDSNGSDPDRRVGRLELPSKP